MAKKAGILLFSSLLLCIILHFTANTCNAEVVIQDVLWTKEYNEDQENYYGTCRFVESPCGINNDGVCIPLQGERCLNEGGMSNGECQGGTGECCQFTARCSEEISKVEIHQLVTNLESPSPVNTQCTFRFKKQKDICQVRLDFEMFTTTGADADGHCLEDRLRITNSITLPRDFATCGDLTGQHMYLTFGSEETIEMSPLLKNANSQYKMIATMIPCQSRLRAPDYCLQYFTRPMDRVKSFDYGRQQQSSQRYSICVKPQPSSESIEWKPCSGETGKTFDIITNIQSSPATCNTDWIQVKGHNSICEPFLGVRSAWKPYDLLVNFDESEFPPSPPTFTIPVDPMNCVAGCVSQPGAYVCSCVPEDELNQVCRCIAETPGVIVGADFNNTGFCLDYTQF